MKTPLAEQDPAGTETTKDYAICGSLCTTADVITRRISLGELKIGDTLRFKRVGAYSVTEGSVLFLSRQMPAIYIRSAKAGTKLIRAPFDSHRLNTQGM